ncbi:high affinity cGMP-specific 3',5'-cyclic phosphodiesterase 9A-like [Pelodytes ibericus]
MYRLKQKPSKTFLHTSKISIAHRVTWSSLRIYILSCSCIDYSAFGEAISSFRVSSIVCSEYQKNQNSSQRKLKQFSEETREAVKRPSLNVWQIQDDQMLSLLENMFYDLNLVTQFNMDPEILKNFLGCVRTGYRANPFHNFRHGFCVAQMMYSVICACQLQDYFCPADILSLMVASLCHDQDHPGLSNAYQVNAGTDLATRYQNTSPLENHHWSVTQNILSKPQTKLLCHATMEEATQINQTIRELILATDLAHHTKILQLLQNIQSFDPSNKQHVIALMKGLIKFCDISNEVRPAEEAEIWADALFEEYFNQSDLEKAEGLPVTPYMDRDTVSKAQSQSSFISFMVLPLCEALAKLLPQIIPLGPLAAAKQRYQDQLQVKSLLSIPADPTPTWKDGASSRDSAWKDKLPSAHPQDCKSYRVDEHDRSCASADNTVTTHRTIPAIANAQFSLGFYP